MKQKVKVLYLLSIFSIIHLFTYGQIDQSVFLLKYAILLAKGTSYMASKTAIPLDQFVNINPSKEERIPIYEEIKSLNRLINQYNDSSKLYLKRGLLNQKNGLFQAAREDFNKAYDLGNKEDTLLFSMGFVRFLLGLENQSSQYIDEYLLKNPYNADACFYRGLVELYCEKSKTKKQYRTAIPFFDRAISINSVHKEALLLRGYSYHANNEFEKALKDYLLLIETGDVKEGVYILAGKAYLGLNNSERACDCFKIASQLNQKIGDKLLSKYCK